MVEKVRSKDSSFKEFMEERLRRAEAKPVRNKNQQLYIAICTNKREDRNEYFIFAGERSQTEEGKKPVFMIRSGRIKAEHIYRKRIPAPWHEAVRGYLLDDKGELVPKMLGYATYQHGGENSPGVVYESRYEPAIEIQRALGPVVDGLADFIGLRLLKREKKAGATKVIIKKGIEPVDVEKLIQKQKEAVRRHFGQIGELLRPA